MIEELEYVPAGAARDLFDSKGVTELLLEGPAGTGKTRAVLEYINFLCEFHPGIRVLFVRATRKSLNESVLVTWEEKVLWPGHPAIGSPIQVSSRDSYTYPNGAHVVLLGLDHPERTFSSEYDIVVDFEAFETTFDAWDKLGRCMRNNVLPWQMRIADTNPAEETHWLNERATAGRMKRLLSRHNDNPSVTPEYLATLEGLRGVNRARLFEGKWVSQEGQVWPEFNPAKHIISARRNKSLHCWQLVVDAWSETVDIDYFIGSMDWGYAHAGVFQVWGVDKDKRMFRIVEVYRTKKTIDFWATTVARYNKLYDLQRVYCDHDPGNVQMLNDKMGWPRGKKRGVVAVLANKSVMAGIDHVRDLLAGNQNGPQMFFVADALQGMDSDLASAGKPYCTEREIPAYTFKPDINGKPAMVEGPVKEDDHGCDATRYAAMGVWKKSSPKNPTAPKLTVGSVPWMIAQGRGGKPKRYPAGA